MQKLWSDGKVYMEIKLEIKLRAACQPNWDRQNLWAFVQNEVPEEQHQSVYYKMALEMRLD
mgnify:CR=1 FL=1